jgi:hypothetical protein
VAECYRSLRDERDFQAGVWLALLLFKPQYGFLIGIFLIWKRRWAAIAGVAVGGMIIIGGSIWVGGMETLLAYPTTYTDMAKFFSEDVYHMINWRSIVITFKPVLTEEEGMFLTSSLAYVTVFFSILAWRGAWLPRDPRFSARFTLLLLATLLISHHSFNYGAVILILPTAAALAEGRHDRFMHLSVIAGIVFPTLSFVIVHVVDVTMASRILTFSIISLYVALLFWLLRNTKTIGYRIKAC